MRSSAGISSRRVLITGANGFVGANLARRLVHDGHEVHALLRPSRDRWRLSELAGDLIVHEGAVQDRSEVTGLVNAVQPEWIFHLAAYGAYPEQKDLDAMIETNVKGTAHLADAAQAAGVKAFVNAGSSSEYGFKDHAPKEDELLEPNSDYAVTKAAASLYCQSLARRTGLPAITLRLYSVYGPYEEPSRLIPTLIRQGLQGTLPPLVSPGTARDYVHVNDVCEAFLLAAEGAPTRGGSIYNVGTGRQTALRDVVEVARRLMDVREAPRWDSMAPRSWDTDKWWSDPASIKSELGWSARLDLEEGLRQTIQWSKQESKGAPRRRE